MSVHQYVYLRGDGLPSSVRWSAAIREAGFDLTFDEDFDPHTFEGFLPCTFGGEKAGFEYYVEENEDLMTGNVRDRDLKVVFSTGGRMEELRCASIAAYVLAAMSDGIFGDEMDSLTPSSECLAAARTFDEEIRSMLSEEGRPSAPQKSPAPYVDVRLETREKFRGANLVVLESLESPPRAFTLRMSTASLPKTFAPRITGLWRGGSVVRELELAGTTLAFDEKGFLLRDVSTLSLSELLAALGTSEKIVRAVLAIGQPAVPALCALVSDASASLEQRGTAIILFGELGARASAAVPVLRSLNAHPALGAAARAALSRVERAIASA